MSGDMKLDLIHGDCLDEIKNIPDESIDMILTDPPYGMSFRSNHRRHRYGYIENDHGLDWIELFSAECFRVAKNNTAHYVFCSFHHIEKFRTVLSKYFRVKNILIWEKNNTGMGDLKGDFAPKYEMIIFMHKGRRLINGRRDANILRFDRTGNTLHPTQKPVDLIEYLLMKFSDDGDLILDPFIGSGSTGVACRNTNRGFIGIEKDETYFNIAKERIEWR